MTWGKLCSFGGEREDGQLGRADFPQWALGGDTWVVGCPIPECTVIPEYNELNPDRHLSKFNSSKYGCYKPNCGLENLRFAYGHDEYMYRMLVHNKCKIPEAGLAMIRYHSCYPLHRGNAYEHFYAEGDEKIIESIIDFNQFDLYTKSDEKPDVGKLWPYYQGLIDEFCPGKLDW